MLVENVIGNLSDFDMKGRKLETVRLEWFEFDKKLLKKDISDSESVGIRLEGTKHLHEGDVLFADDTRVIAVEMLPCELTVVPVSSMKEMGRLCFELGNRHLSLAIEEAQVSVVYDQPTFEYLEKSGFAPEKVLGKFKNYTVCHAHGHSHEHDNDHHHAHE